jgi:DNA helicase-2/ATP-dependent DNA helicase PcrA
VLERRAALEMERRVGRVLHDALGLAPLQQGPRLAWCGTFHSVGARLLRGVAARIGLDESFTVDDRADSEDLIHLLRQRLGLATGASRFPQKRTCLAIYSRAVNARRPLADVLVGISGVATTRTHACSPPTPKKQAQRVLDFDDLFRPGGPGVAPGRRGNARFDPFSSTNTGTQSPAGRDRLAPAPDGSNHCGDDAGRHSFHAPRRTSSPPLHAPAAPC